VWLASVVIVIAIAAPSPRLPPEIARWNEFGPEYGLQVVGPPIPEDA